ncbi:hypothetical protein [Nostoc sp.]|uniref:hypothetical protein n=1 Tax=Nostoc sp. TaxID=1180 RepID=UPI002FFCF82E
MIGLWTNMFKGMFQRPNILIVFFIFTTLVGFVGYELGKTPTNANQKITILLGLAGTGVTWLNLFINLEIKTVIDEEKKSLQQQYNRDEVGVKYNTHFISLVSEQLALEKITEVSLRKNETQQQFKSRIKNNLERIKNSQEALNGLLSSRKKNGKDVYLLDSIAFTALEEIEISINTSEDEKFKHLYAYLRAWLICGIRYDTENLPIDWIKENALNQQEQIRALKYIKNQFINDTVLRTEIPKKESREIIAHYLEVLIKKIELYQPINSQRK